MTDNERPDLPEGIGLSVRPPRAALTVLQDRDQKTLCGGAFAITWKQGPWRGNPVTVYCAEPLCIDTGKCEGTRFVPHMDQFTTLDVDSPFRRRRKITVEEAVAASKKGAEQARKQTGRGEERSDSQIARHIGYVWKKMLTALRGEGDWTT